MAGPTASNAGSTVVSIPENDARETQQDASASGAPSLPKCKSRFFSWRVAGAVLALLVVLGWIFIIVMLILEEKWQLVLVAWLLLYSAAHFCYWYCKRHSLITLHRHIRLHVRAHSRNGETGEKADDGPPSYDEVMKTEAPPPAYFTVVSEDAKPSAAFSPCVPEDGVVPTIVMSEVPAESSCIEKQQSQEECPQESNKAKKNRPALTLEIRECPPAYQSPRSPRALSPRILPSVHETGSSLVTATAAASAAATATAAFSYLAPAAALSETETLEDPIRNPIVQHLRSTTMPTIEVSSNVDVSNGCLPSEVVTGDVTRDQIEEIIDMNRSSIF